MILQEHIRGLMDKGMHIHVITWHAAVQISSSPLFQGFYYYYYYFNFLYPMIFHFQHDISIQSKLSFLTSYPVTKPTISIALTKQDTNRLT